MIKQLGITRFIAAIAIVLFHYGQDIAVFMQSHLFFLVQKASIGVSFFFVLSGFVMVIAYSKNKTINYKDFYINRFARIYPLYFLALVVVLILRFAKEFDFLNLFLNSVMLQSWYPNRALSLNIPGWSISVELFFYLLFPVFYNLFYNKKNPVSVAFCVLAFWIISQFVFIYFTEVAIPNNTFYELSDLYYLPILHINAFFIGNLGGLLFTKNKKESNYLLPILAILAFLILVLKFSIPFHNGLLSIPFAIFIYFFSQSTDKITTFCKNNLFVFLGEISFGIYILQYPIFTFFTNFRLSKILRLNQVEDINYLFTIRIFILIFAAGLSYYLFENPLRKLIKNRFQ